MGEATRRPLRARVSALRALKRWRRTHIPTPSLAAFPDCLLIALAVGNPSATLQWGGEGRRGAAAGRRDKRGPADARCEQSGHFPTHLGAHMG